MVYFDPQTATLIPYSRLEYFILAERDKPTIVYSTKVRGESLKPCARNVSALSASITIPPDADSSSFSVPMAEEVGLIKPPTFP